MCSPGQPCSRLNILSALPMCQIAKQRGHTAACRDSPGRTPASAPEMPDDLKSRTNKLGQGMLKREKGFKVFLILFVFHLVHDNKKWLYCATRIQEKLP